MNVEGLPTGFVFARDYRIVRFLAEGGMGRVYVAEQLSTGKERALKVMRSEFLRGPEARARFVQEARLSARIESDHVAEVLSAGVDELTGLPFIAMELLQGETLEDYLLTHGPMPIGHLVEIFAQLGHALSRGHALGIVHRDLKPENVFLAHAKRRGATFTVKLLDFGIAKVIHEGAIKTTTPMGTPLYMAPEQFSGHELTAAVDVWALGIIAFRALVGSSYWHSPRRPNASVLTLMHEIAYSALEPASRRAELFGARVPVGFDGWFARCIERDLGKRFSSVTDALFVFERLYGAQAVALTPALPPVIIPSPKPPVATTQPWQTAPSDLVIDATPSRQRPRIVQEPPRSSTPPRSQNNDSLSGESFSPRHSEANAPAPRERSLLLPAAFAAGVVVLGTLGLVVMPEQASALASILTEQLRPSPTASAPLLPPATPLPSNTVKPTAPEPSPSVERADPPSLDRKVLAQRCRVSNDSSACFLAGQRYRWGEVDIGASPPRIREPRNVEKARELLDRGCDLGEPRACREAGLIHWKADDVQHDPKTARDYFERACTAQTGEGCELLGDMHDMGADGLEIDAAQGLALDRKGCESDEPIGCIEIAKKDKDGDGRSGGEKALRLLRQRCAEGGIEHCGRLGAESRFGGVWPRDLTTAESALRTACTQSHMPSCVQLGEMYTKREATAPSVDAATQLFNLACQMGEPSGCDQTNPGQARLLRIAACDRGDYQACHALGMRAAPIAARKAEAHDYLSRACKQGYRASCFESAELLQRAPELDSNAELARERMQRACTLRYPRACEHALLTAQATTIEPGEFRVRCAHGDSQACVIWGNEQGGGQCANNTKSDWQWAYQLACDSHVASGCTQLARCLFRGSPTPMEAQRGTMLMAKACLHLEHDASCRDYADRIYGACLNTESSNCPQYFALACVFKHERACQRLDTPEDLVNCFELCTKLTPAHGRDACHLRCQHSD